MVKNAISIGMSLIILSFSFFFNCIYAYDDETKQIERDLEEKEIQMKQDEQIIQGKDWESKRFQYDLDSTAQEKQDSQRLQEILKGQKEKSQSEHVSREIGNFLKIILDTPLKITLIFIVLVILIILGTKFSF